MYLLSPLNPIMRGLLAVSLSDCACIALADDRVPFTVDTNVYEVKGDGAQVTSFNNRLTLDQSRIIIEGAGGSAIQNVTLLFRTESTFNPVVILKNGSEISTQDGIGLHAKGTDFTLQVSDSRIITRTKGDIDKGILLKSSNVTLDTASYMYFPRRKIYTFPTQPSEIGKILLDASNAQLIGDVQADYDTVSVSLKNGSSLTGASLRDGEGRLDATLDPSSVWNVRGDSNLNTLNNAGVRLLTCLSMRPLARLSRTSRRKAAFISAINSPAPRFSSTACVIV